MVAASLLVVALLAMATVASARYNKDLGYGGTCVPGYDKDCVPSTIAPPTTTTIARPTTTTEEEIFDTSRLPIFPSGPLGETTTEPGPEPFTGPTPGPEPGPGSTPKPDCGLIIPKDCVFPFYFKQLPYTTCTGLDAKETLWCSTTKNFTGQWKRCKNPCKDKLPVKSIVGGVLAGSVAATGIGLLATAIYKQQEGGKFNPFAGMVKVKDANAPYSIITTLSTAPPTPAAAAFLPSTTAAPVVVTLLGTTAAPVVAKLPGKRPGVIVKSVPVVESVPVALPAGSRRLLAGAEAATAAFGGAFASGTFVWAFAAAGLLAVPAAVVVAGRRKYGKATSHEEQQI